MTQTFFVFSESSQDIVEAEKQWELFSFTDGDASGTVRFPSLPDHVIFPDGQATGTFDLESGALYQFLIFPLTQVSTPEEIFKEVIDNFPTSDWEVEYTYSKQEAFPILDLIAFHKFSASCIKKE